VTTDNLLLSDTHHDESTACQVKSILLQMRPGTVPRRNVCSRLTAIASG
jgi:hypothetical protein